MNTYIKNHIFKQHLHPKETFLQMDHVLICGFVVSNLETFQCLAGLHQWLSPKITNDRTLYVMWSNNRQTPFGIYVDQDYIDKPSEVYRKMFFLIIYFSMIYQDFLGPNMQSRVEQMVNRMYQL